MLNAFIEFSGDSAMKKYLTIIFIPIEQCLFFNFVWTRVEHLHATIVMSERENEMVHVMLS